MIPVESHVDCTNYNNLITSIYNNISNNNNNNNNNNSNNSNSNSNSNSDSNKNEKEAKDGVQMGVCFDSFICHPFQQCLDMSKTSDFCGIWVTSSVTSTSEELLRCAGF